jgi:hypothetical protein
MYMYDYFKIHIEERSREREINIGGDEKRGRGG